MDNTHASSPLDRIARSLILALFFLVPVFAVPSLVVPFVFSKNALFTILVALAMLLWALARIRDGEASLPRGPVLPLLAALTAVSVLSALFSGALRLSWSGAWFDASSLAFFLALVVFLFLCAVLLRSADHIFYALALSFASAGLVALFHLVRIIAGPELLAFEFFTVPTATLLARWTDVGIFFGAIAVFLLVTLEFMKLRTGLRILFGAALLASLALIAVSNLTAVWLLLGSFALIFVVYLVSFRHMERAAYEEVRHPGADVDLAPAAPGTADSAPSAVTNHTATSAISAPRRKIPPLSLGIFLCALAFVIFAGPLGNRISARLNIVSVEARPSFGATMEIAKQTLKSDPLLGAGPNLFSRAWLAFKPDGANQTIFWNTNFSSGVGFLPTMLVTTGLAGATLWALFLAAYLYAGFQFILARSADKVARYLVGAPFLTSLFLWLVLVFYAPGTTPLVLAFGFTGLTLAALAVSGATRARLVRFADNPARSFASVLALIIVVLAAGALAWGVGNRFLSAVSFSQGIRSANETGDLEAAARLLERASARAPLDLYARALAEVSLAQMNALAASTNAQNAEVSRAEFEVLLGRAIGYGKRAVSADEKNYENWLTLGRVYEAVVPLKIAGAYEAAKNAYETAQAQNPKNPGIILARARLETAQGNNDAARAFIAQSLQMKLNYTEAVFLLSQLEVQEGNIAGAIDSVSAAIFLSPEDPVLHFQLGLLKYNQKDWSGAASAFERAVSQNEQYANARYFLGLSSYQLKRVSDAVRQFEELAKTNPDNKEVALILSNLKTGRPPFADALPPVDASPERRQTLPVENE